MKSLKSVAVAFVFTLLIALLCSVAVAGWSSFGFGGGGKLGFNLPNVPLTAKEEADLYEGKAITRLLPSQNSGYKAGYLRFFAPFDPVTTYMIVTDSDHFDLVDPSFPNNGSITSKRRTFMPYTFESITCNEGGKNRMYQLLVMPIVAPRQMCIDRIHRTNAFPWESRWKLADVKNCCASKQQEKNAEYREKAVSLETNNGGWSIGPLPAKFRKTEADQMRTDVIYYVDTNPGGDIGQLKGIVNKATSTALPNLQKNVLFHGKNWEQHLQKYHGATAVSQYKTWIADYKAAMAAK